ncbi:MAG TPA: alkaline phosphatase D family protein, partial [Burkholderiales bacterium]|nr:alkaline phosphatase D family protein [Burkholderiales bacterium]
YERLQARLTDAVERLRPRCLLLVGDQVYIDPTAGFFDPSTLSDRYDLPYERLLQTKPLRQVLRRVPLHTMLDDHEIEDNWEPPSGGVDNLEKGRKYYLAYQRMAWPPPPPPVRLWYRFEANGFPFFMADTRTERQPRDAGCIGTARIMKDDQFTELTSWLSRQDKDMPKFIATPAAFLPRHRRATHGPSGAGALRSDSWDGYRASFDALVKHVADNRIQNVVFLSGDEHISFATTAVVSDRSGNAVTRILSVHSSALYAPFAFANSTQENLAGDDSFDSGSYRLTVTSTFAAPGDGFALLRTWRDNGRWHVCCLFDREPPEPEVWIDLA